MTIQIYVAKEVNMIICCDLFEISFYFWRVLLRLGQRGFAEELVMFTIQEMGINLHLD